MNGSNSKDPLLFMIVISCSALLSRGSTEITKEITKDNCKNNRTFVSGCFFNISFQPPLMEKLECFLEFSTKTNYSVRFSNDPFVLQRQVDHMCPQFLFRIFSLVEEPKRIYSACGRQMYPFSIHFNYFTLAYIQYDNEGLIDNSTTMKMELRLETGEPCNEEIVKPLNSKTFDVKNHLSWIIILSLVGFIVLIIVCAVIVYRSRFKGNERKAPNPTLTEADVPLCVPVECGSGKDRDMRRDSFASVKCSEIVEGKC